MREAAVPTSGKHIETYVDVVLVVELMLAVSDFAASVSTKWISSALRFPQEPMRSICAHLHTGT